MWALPYPATHELNVLERDPGGRTHGRPLQAGSHRIHGHSPALATARSVIIASERMDNDRGWRIIEPCELLHIDVNLTPTAAGRYPQPLPIR
jgi:predicted glutamine amidotransferase